MNSFWNYPYTTEFPGSYFFIISIFIFVTACIAILLYLYISKLHRLHVNKMKAKYNPIIETIFFKLLFNNEAVVAVLESTEYKTYSQGNIFQRTLLNNMLELNRAYSGEYNNKFEEFYRKSGLIKSSYRKLEANAWYTKCEGIRELTYMNIQESYFDIYKLINRKPNTLLLEALLGIIRLKGFNGLSILSVYNEPVNEWTQANIIHEVSEPNESASKILVDFLTSKNETIVVLGLRLISKFKEVKNYGQVKELLVSSSSSWVKEEAEKTLTALSPFVLTV